MERVIIIGSGPAGLTAAVYAARANLRPLVLAGGLYGGQLMLTTEVENYPGFPEGIQGPDLMIRFREQAERFGARVENVDVTSVDFSKRPHVVRTTEEQYEAETVIVATGASARWLDVPGEERLRGRGVSSCATCDGAFFRDKDIVVVGGGDSAVEEALFLTRFGRQVTVIHRRDRLRASKIMADRMQAHEKIDFLWNTVVEEVLGETHVTGLRLRNVQDGSTLRFRDRLALRRDRSHPEHRGLRRTTRLGRTRLYRLSGRHRHQRRGRLRGRRRERPSLPSSRYCSRRGMPGGDGRGEVSRGDGVFDEAYSSSASASLRRGNANV